MKNAKQITLSGITFSIEVDAYELLNNYLIEIKNYFGEKINDLSVDILEDIESSIAEKMIDKGRGVPKAITFKDVQEIKEQLGEVSEMDDENTGQITTKKKKNKTKKVVNKKRRLYRDIDDVIIAGVASGLAKYFGVDVAFIRIIFVVSVFIHGIGILIYIILWVAVQKAETSEQKMAMRGESVNLESLKSYLDDKIQNIPENTRDGVKGLMDSIFLVLKKIFNFIIKRLFPIIKYIVGILFIIVGAIGIFAVIIVLLAYYNSGFSIAMDPITAEFFGKNIANVSVWSVVALSVVALVPFWFMGIFGNYLAPFKRGKNKKTPVVEIVTLLMLWVFAMVYTSAYIATNSLKIESYINTVKKEVGVNPNVVFYLNIVDEDDKTTVLDLNLRHNVLKIQDDEDVILVPFGDDEKIKEVEFEDYEK